MINEISSTPQAFPFTCFIVINGVRETSFRTEHSRENNTPLNDLEQILAENQSK